MDSADSLHLQIEAVKLAFADGWRYVADIDHMDVRPETLLDKEYLKASAKLIDTKRAQDFGHGKPPKGGTVYLTAADASGMMVSLHPVELHGLRLGHRGAGHRHLAAEPRLPASCSSRATPTASGPASAPSRPSSRASSRRMAGR